MTFYWGSEPELGYGTGDQGACDNDLRPMKSVAVKHSNWERYKGSRVVIEGYCCDCVVDDYCLGSGCKDLDLYVGNKNSGKYDGVKSVKYAFGDKVRGHPCL